MIPIYESDRIAGYDDWLANSKTNTYDTYEDPIEDTYEHSKDILAIARKNHNVILDGSQIDYTRCEKCRYSSDVIITNPDDDFGRIVCFARKCPYNVWTINIDEDGNKYIHFAESDDDIYL